MPTGVPHLLDAVVAGLGLPTVDLLVTVHERWSDIVGSEVVDHARPVRLDGQKLIVAVDAAAWASHLRWAEPEIVKRLDALIGPGQVTSVQTRVVRS